MTTSEERVTVGEYAALVDPCSDMEGSRRAIARRMWLELVSLRAENERLKDERITEASWDKHCRRHEHKEAELLRRAEQAEARVRELEADWQAIEDMEGPARIADLESQLAELDDLRARNAKLETMLAGRDAEVERLKDAASALGAQLAARHNPEVCVDVQEHCEKLREAVENLRYAGHNALANWDTKGWYQQRKWKLLKDVLDETGALAPTPLADAIRAAMQATEGESDE